MSYTPESYAPPGFIPRGTYTVYCHSVENTQSKKGNLMDAIRLEIISPMTAISIQKDGSRQTCKTAGTDINTFLVYQNDSWLAARVEGLKRIGITVKKSYDGFEDYVKHLQSQTKNLVGMCFDLTIDSEAEPARKPLSPEDIAKGITEGQEIRGPDGKPQIIRYRARCDFAQIVGNLRKKDNIPNWNVSSSSAPEATNAPQALVV